MIGGSAGIGLETARRGTRRGSRRHPHGPRSRAPRARRGRGRRVEHRGLRRHRLRTARSVLRRVARADRPRAGHRPRPVLRAVGGLRLRRGAPRRRGASLAAAAGRPHAAHTVRPAGRLLFMGGTGGRRTGVGMALISALTAAMPALAQTWRSSSRRSASTSSRPASSTRRCRRRSSATSSTTAASSSARRCRSAAWSAPADVAALAVHIMTNTALTGATYDIDGGQQLVAEPDST